MMEHEQINDRCVALSTRCTKMTGRVLAQLMLNFLRKAKNPKAKHGKQSTKSLSKKGGALADIEISGDNIGAFKKTARKYNIDFSLQKDDSQTPPKWTVFFKAKDDRAMQSAFNEYAKITLKQKSRKKTMLDKLEKAKQQVQSTPTKVRERVKDVAHVRG